MTDKESAKLRLLERLDLKNKRSGAVMQKTNDRLYRAAIYLRLSQEDGDISVSDKNESNASKEEPELRSIFIWQLPDDTP